MTKDQMESIVRHYYETRKQIKDADKQFSLYRTTPQLAQRVPDKLRELGVSLNIQARQRTLSAMRISEPDFMNAIEASNECEPAKSYIAGCEAHSSGLSQAALLSWATSSTYHHAESMFQLGCYFQRGIVFPHNEVVAQSCFRAALEFGFDDLVIEIFALAMIENIDKAISFETSDAKALDNYVSGSIFNIAVQNQIIMLKGSSDALTFKCQLFTDFPKSIRGSNIVGLWEIAVKAGIGKQENDRLLMYPPEINAAKALRSELNIQERDIYSDEFVRQQHILSAPQRLLNNGWLSGFLRSRSDSQQ